jgi:transcription antitermination factor NusB
MHSQRHLSRIVAMQTIFSVLSRSTEIDIEKNLVYIANQLPSKLNSLQFAQELTQGVFDNKKEIEETIKKSTNDKSLEKIDLLTLSILFLGTYELCFSKNKQATPVVINEAIELAKSFAKDSAPSLINAVLSKIINLSL